MSDIDITDKKLNSNKENLQCNYSKITLISIDRGDEQRLNIIATQEGLDFAKIIIRFVSNLDEESQNCLARRYDACKTKEDNSALIEDYIKDLKKEDKERCLREILEFAKTANNVLLINATKSCINEQSETFTISKSAEKASEYNAVSKRNINPALVVDIPVSPSLSQQVREAINSISSSNAETFKSTCEKLCEALELIASATAIANKKNEEIKASQEQAKEAREVKENIIRIAGTDALTNEKVKEFIRMLSSKPNFFNMAFGVSDIEIMRIIDEGKRAEQKNSSALSMIKGFGSSKNA